MRLNLLHRLHLDSLRSRLLLLVVLSLIPPLALNLYGAMRERRHAIGVAEKDIQRLTALAASGEAKYIEGTRQFLIALSDVPDLMGNPESCSATLQTMLKKNIGYVNLGLLDLNGDVRCSAFKPPPSVNVSDREYFKKTVAAGTFAIGDYVLSRITHKPAVIASYPVFDQNNKIIAVVFASMNMNALDQFATDIDLPANAVMITADSKGTIIGRRPDPESWVGTRASQQLFDGMVKVGFGTAEITGTDNIKRLHAFAPVGGPDTSNFTVSIGIPTTDIIESANRDQIAELLTLAVTAALALLTAWFVANVTIIDRVQALVSAARRIADGQLSTRSGIHYGSEEISELARTFDRMAYSLQHSAAERDDAQARLFAEKERAQVTLESIGDAVITTDQAGCVEYMNPVAESLTGWSTAEAMGKPLAAVFNVVNGSTREAVSSVVVKALERGRTEGFGRDSVLIERSGNEYAVEDSAAPIRNREQNIVGTVVVFKDVSQSRNLARQLSYQASHDPLTGLVNRREFERRLQLLIDHRSQQTRQHALLFMDLDRFKIVNDTCGHNAGDELLRQITALLQPLQRDSDTLARVGGDEFAALLENCSPSSATRIAERLCKTICEFRFTWQNQIFPIGVSIGLVNFGTGDINLIDLMKAADSACYQAKDEGRNRVHQYRADESGDALLKGENVWRSKIQAALEGDGFVLLSQEVQPLKSSELHLPASVSRLDQAEPLIHHYDIQVRMVNEQGMHVLPSAFTPAAERHELMPAIDRWVMRHAFAYHAHQLKRHTDRANAICAIPISATALNDASFLDFLRDLFREFSMPGKAICFNIAETTAITYLSQSMQFINYVKSMGCLIALDDFGGGMSSFSYLSHLGVNFVKIDGAFVENLPNDAIDRAKIEAINNVAHAMNIMTISKNVQHQAALVILREIGIDHVQGDAVEGIETLPENNGMPL
jgi:diguanylate cyclase (GGDEF)-like protein/PAS domain S-box-containing protein